MMKNYKKEYYQENKDRIREYYKNYVKENGERIIKIKRKYNRSEKGLNKAKEYTNRPEIKKKIRIYKRNWQRKELKENLNFAIKRRLQRRLNHAINLYIKEKRYLNSKKFKLDYKNIINQLKPFPKNIKEYHIDHIKPLCSFDLTKKEEVEKAFDPKNHQWLLIKENLSKGGKIENV